MIRSSSATRERLRPFAFEQLVRAANLDERDGDVAVLGVGRLATQLARVRRWKELRQVDAPTGRRTAA